MKLENNNLKRQAESRGGSVLENIAPYDENSELESEIERLKKECGEMNKSMTTLKTDNERLQREVSRVQGEKKDWQNDAERLRRERDLAQTCNVFLA